jgi:hypothetical protein
MVDGVTASSTTTTQPAIGIIIILLILIISIVFIIFWIFMLINAIKRDFKNSNEKIIWILVIILTGIIGAIIYYFVVKRPDKH